MFYRFIYLINPLFTPTYIAQMTTPLNDASAGEAYLTTHQTANQILAHQNPEAQLPPGILAAIQEIMVQSENRLGNALREALVELEQSAIQREDTLRASVVLSVIRSETRLANQIAELRQDINSLQNSIRSMTDGTTQAMNRARDALPNQPNQ
ncbi:hypothetical protein PGT21_010882 [Puccinia graminis f. sp. tritici]|uniref:Uncharacterized protein n=1 Tax=Puccinia graminis f. sp. tritici TaxID=56615 RepID=A0A5B0MKG3_PUCGR|nr:hypothetical protein PGT21_010882 [Puccinia graminis f. sp. tritici]